ncbi:hypothetical protein V1521DRAFT_436996 [Lipomyces starkeyi]
MHISEGNHGERPEVQYDLSIEEVRAGRPSEEREVSSVFSRDKILLDRWYHTEKA